MSVDERTLTYGTDISGAAMDLFSEVDRMILSMVIRGVDISEVYSPERVANTCKRFGLGET